MMLTRLRQPRISHIAVTYTRLQRIPDEPLRGLQERLAAMVDRNVWMAPDVLRRQVSGIRVGPVRPATT